jgi:hypothetical protein
MPGPAARHLPPAPPSPPACASSRPRPSTAARSPSSAPATPPTSRTASTRCCSKQSQRSPASSTHPATTQPGRLPGRRAPGTIATPARSTRQPSRHEPRHHQDLPEHEDRTLPTHVQTAWPLTHGMNLQVITSPDGEIVGCPTAARRGPRPDRRPDLGHRARTGRLWVERAGGQGICGRRRPPAYSLLRAALTAEAGRPGGAAWRSR